MILGITGSFGAGKGAVVDYLVQEKGFKHFPARAFITEEILVRGLSVDRDSMTFVANELRATHGPTYIIESLFNQAMKVGGDAVIESIREIAGAHFIQEHGGIVLGIDASPEIRFARVIKRASETDHVSFEKWLEQEQKESNPNDRTKQDIFGALKASDVIIQNEGSLEELYVKLDAFLADAAI
jgi:dephospho-CoA kinase